ncbi:zinc finger protein [Musa troglodytarum]|uniref:Zinc finger protein n=1 Tax=Musa troglodytarum TaxID=320322 RepID=A0A9E7FYX9_9LILI|nr:zinc finger protein [Musa troglodytarum]
MASASRPMSFFEAREDEHRMQAMQQQQSSSVPAPSTAAPVKKRRNLSGNPCKYLIAQIMHNDDARRLLLGCFR